MQHPVLIVPGIYNSGPEHWQSLWEAKYPHFQRVIQRDWDHPVREEWVATLLVAAPDPTGPDFPVEAIGFAPVPLNRLPFKSIVAASTDDPYSSIEYAERCASAWGSQLVNVGARGHINASSGLGDWPEGYALLESLI